MESLPLIVKSNIYPNLDVTPVIREIFQSEFESYVPSKKLSENLRKSLEYEREENEGTKSYRSVPFLENLCEQKGKLMDYAENVFEAYGKHEEALGKIAGVELNIMETQAIYLKREGIIRENRFLEDLLRLKRHPLMTSYRADYVKQFKLLQGDSGLPLPHEANLDFRVRDFKKWKKRVISISRDSLIMGYVNKTPCGPAPKEAKARPTKTPRARERRKRPKKTRTRTKDDGDDDAKTVEIFRADPSLVYFTEYVPGQKYECWVVIKNVYTQPMKCAVRPLPAGSKFKVEIHGRDTSRILPGNSFRLLVTFAPDSIDDESEHLAVLIEDGSRLFIPLVSYQDPPVLKTHKELDEFTKNVPERIRSSYIDCGACFPGDSKVTKLRFWSYGGTGEFFIMNMENWTSWHIDCLTADNFTDVPPFRLYPTYFRLDRNQVVDLYVEFKPPTSGLHAENIIIACNNGEIRYLDIMGDGVAWNRAFFLFEDYLEKNFPPYIDDDPKAMYYLDVGQCLSTGKLEETFSISNISNMAFEFRWEMREAILPARGEEEIMRLSRGDVRIEPSSGTFEPSSVRKFAVSVTVRKKPVGKYRTVLSLYIIGLPYESIEQPSTIIRPSVLRARFKSGSLSGEEENVILSPECSYQDTYESVQESMKSSGETKLQQQFPMTVCRKHPSLCAIPLKKSKTFSNIGDEVCTCAMARPSEPEPAPIKAHCYDDDGYQRRGKPNITELGSDLLWDFVDVLVDEVELWAEILPTLVAVEPNIVDFQHDVKVNEPPVVLTVNVHNYSNNPVTCKWIRHPGKGKERGDEKSEELNTIFCMKRGSRDDDDDDDDNDDDDVATTDSRNYSAMCEGEWDYPSGASSATGNSLQDYQINSYLSQRCSSDPDTVPEALVSKLCDVRIDPRNLFTVPPQASYACRMTISATEPGIVNKVLFLNVNDELTLQLFVVGKVPEKEFHVTPTILDFGLRKRGSLYTKHFKVQSDCVDPLEWSMKMYKLDAKARNLVGPVREEQQSNVEFFGGAIRESKGCTIESYTLDARKPGLHCSLLRFQLAKPALANTPSKYILVLGSVQTPKLVVEAPRFNNAILAPNRTMYVGQMITQTISLRNMTDVATTFVWGYPFGCHCRRLKISLCPKFCFIAARKKVAVQVKITPLEEGIVEHCYIPCFYSRDKSPVLLAVVGVVKSLQVVFEIVREGPRPCQEAPDPTGRPLKIPWPIKNFDPSVGINHLPEEKILDFVCHCNEVEAEYLRTTMPEKEAEELKMMEDEAPGEMRVYGEGYGEMEFCEPDDETPEKDACIMKYYTPERMMELRKSIAEKRAGPKPPAEEEPAYGEMGEADVEEEEEEEPEPPPPPPPHRSKPPSCVPSFGKDLDTESGTVAEFPKTRNCIDLLHYVASEIQFLDVLHKTVAVKQFVIKNDSSVRTSFSLRVRYFSRVNQIGCKNKLKDIKSRVMGRVKGEFDDSLIYGQPLVIAVSPSEGVLEGWDSIHVNVSVYGNTWGEYRDFIICDVCGLPPFVMKVFVQLSGHPVLFPMFTKSLLDTPVLRYSTVKYKTDPVVRNIRVRNTSSIPITVTWMVFLTYPLAQEDKEDPFNLCLDFYTSKGSEDPEKTTKSSRNYLSKNTSGSVLLMDMDMDKMSSQYTAMEPMSGSEAGPKGNGSSPVKFDAMDHEMTPLPSDTTKPEIQLLENFGKMDLQVFQINPRELDLEAYSDEKISVTFDPNHVEQKIPLQEFEAVATGCVRLRQEHAHYPDIYHRPCGRDYVSKLLYISASVEKPVLEFGIFRNDLTFVVNANDILKLKSGEHRVTRKYLVKNKSETEVSAVVKIEPGEMFSVKGIRTCKGKYAKAGPDYLVNVRPGSSIEVQLEMSINRNQVLEFFRKLSLAEASAKRGERRPSRSSELIRQSNIMPSRLSSEASLAGQNKETVEYYEICSDDATTSDGVEKRFSIMPKDSLVVIENKMKVKFGSKTLGYAKSGCRLHVYGDEGEDYGEAAEFPSHLEEPREDEEVKPNFLHVVQEDMIFDQIGLQRQVVTPELRIFFPALKIKPDNLDFGNVYIGETSRRYVSVLNLTQFPTDFTVTPEDKGYEIRVYPQTDHLRATNYKSDAGKELTVEFTPARPGYFNMGFKIYGNRECEFEYFSLTVIGFGTWNEKYKYPKSESSLKLPDIRGSCDWL